MLYNIEILCKATNKAIKFYDNYSLMASEVKNKAKNKTNGKWVIILTPKNFLKKLPIALAEVKTGNNSLFNEIKQIVYSLYQSKEITKRVYNNIIMSIQL